MKLVPVATKYKTKDGEDVFNISLKTKVQKDGSVMQGLMDGKHIIIEKIFPKGYENKYADYSSFAVNVKYEGKICSFFLYEKDHTAFEQAGGSGDLVKVAANSYEYDKRDKKGEIVKDADGNPTKLQALGLTFSKVE